MSEVFSKFELPESAASEKDCSKFSVESQLHSLYLKCCQSFDSDDLSQANSLIQLLIEQNNNMAAFYGRLFGIHVPNENIAE